MLAPQPWEVYRALKKWIREKKIVLDYRFGEESGLRGDKLSPWSKFLFVVAWSLVALGQRLEDRVVNAERRRLDRIRARLRRLGRIRFDGQFLPPKGSPQPLASPSVEQFNDISRVQAGANVETWDKKLLDFFTEEERLLARSGPWYARILPWGHRISSPKAKTKAKPRRRGRVPKP